MRLLKLTQIESGKAFYINPEEIASIDPVTTMKQVHDIEIGKDYTITYTQLTFKNGVKAKCRETPDVIAPVVGGGRILTCGPEGNAGPSGPKADYTAKHGHGTEPWSPDSNLERSKNVGPLPVSTEGLVTK